MNEQTLSYLKILKYGPLSYLSDQAFEESISVPGHARINFLQWIFSKIMDDAAEFNSIKNNQNSDQDNYKKLLKSAISIGMCSNNDLDIIMGTNKTPRKWKFIEKIVECVMFLDDTIPSINQVNNKTISILENYNLDEEIENLMLPKEQKTPLLPPDIENILYKYISSNSNEYDLETKLSSLNNLILQKDFDIKDNLKEHEAKSLKDSQVEHMDIKEDQVATAANNLLSQLSITSRKFQDLYDEEFKALSTVVDQKQNCVGVEAKRFMEGGKLEQLNKILKNFCDIEEHHDNICSDENIHKVEQVSSRLNNELYNDFFTGEKVSITELIGSTSQALRQNNLDSS